MLMFAEPSNSRLALPNCYDVLVAHVPHAKLDAFAFALCIEAHSEAKRLVKECSTQSARPIAQVAIFHKGAAFRNPHITQFLY